MGNKILNLKLIPILIVACLSIQHGLGQTINRIEEKKLLLQLRASRPDTNRIKLLLKVGKFYAYKEGNFQIDLDSGYQFLHWARMLSDTLKKPFWQHESESTLVILLMNKGKKNIAEPRFLKLIAECEKTHDIQSEANARFRYAMSISAANSNAPEALNNFIRSADLYKALDEQKEEIRIRYEIAFIHFNNGQAQLAQHELLDVIRQYKLIHYTKMHYAYNLLSTSYRIQGDLNNALKYAILCIENMAKTQDTVRQGYFYSDLARIYLELGDRQKAIENYKTALAKWMQDKTPDFGVYLAQGYIVKDEILHRNFQQALHSTINLQNSIPPVTLIEKACLAEDLAYCYESLGKDEIAEKYYLNAVSLYETSGMNFEVTQEAYQNVGRFYLAERNYQKANQYLNHALKLSPQKLSLAALSDIHFMLYKVDSAQRNYLAGFDQFSIYKTLNDSVFNRFRTREITFIQSRYENAKKEHQFQLLNKQGQLDKASLEHAALIRKVLLGGLVLLFLILGLLLNRYYIKQRSNRQLLKQQFLINSKNDDLIRLISEKEWFVRETHHRVKKNLHMIVGLLESQSAYLHSEDALEAVKDSQRRVHVMSLIHQKLYLGDNPSAIFIPSFISELVVYLDESYRQKIKIRFITDVDPVYLDVSIVTPIGLILNEAVTNSIKFGFKNENGQIAITLKKENERYRLTVADNGVGLPSGFSSQEKFSSLGMTLIKGLAREINGTFDITGDGGTMINIRFPIKAEEL